MCWPLSSRAGPPSLIYADLFNVASLQRGLFWPIPPPSTVNSRGCRGHGATSSASFRIPRPSPGSCFIWVGFCSRFDVSRPVRASHLLLFFGRFALGSYLRLGYTRYWCFHLVPPRLGTTFDVSAGLCRFTCAAFRVALCHWPCCDAKYEKHGRFQQQDISDCVMCKHID